MAKFGNIHIGNQDGDIIIQQVKKGDSVVVNNRSVNISGNSRISVVSTGENTKIDSFNLTGIKVRLQSYPFGCSITEGKQNGVNIYLFGDLKFKNSGGKRAVLNSSCFFSNKEIKRVDYLDDELKVYVDSEVGTLFALKAKNDSAYNKHDVISNFSLLQEKVLSEYYLLMAVLTKDDKMYLSSPYAGLSDTLVNSDYLQSRESEILAVVKKTGLIY